MRAMAVGKQGPPSIPGFEFLEPVGRGGMGEVYIARQLALGRLVAIKFLTMDSDEAGDVRAARFRREAELMAKVSHPNILSVYDFGEADGRSYLVLEYVAGGDLRRRMRPGEPLPIEQARAILRPVGEALACLHRQGILHRDLKPENILMHDETDPRVTDFGIAVLRAGAGGLTRTGGLGTLGYVAPEQQYNLKVDERADQYSLAALSYELLTGQLPLGLFKPPSQLNRRLGPAVDDVILRGLQENPKDRFPTIQEFVSALDRATYAPDLSAWASGSRPARLWLAAGLLLALALTAWLRGPRTPAPALPGAVSSPAPAVRIDLPPAKPKAPMSPGGGPTSSKIREALVKLRAEKIWKDRGGPNAEPGKDKEDWSKAERQVEALLKERAYQIFEERGKPPGRVAELENWAEAERRLYREWTGHNPKEIGP